MTESSVIGTIDLRDKTTPPPDDPERAPYGYKWDTKARQWVAKRSAGGRKPGAAWFGKAASSATTDDTPEGEPVSSGDPGPSYMDAPSVKLPKTPLKVSAKTKSDMTAAVGMVGMIIGPPLMSMDPYCGGVFVDNMQKIADAVVPLLCQSATVVAFFSDSPGSDWMLWFKLAIALSPVAMAIGRHHIFKTVEIQQDEKGDLYAVSTQPDLSEYPA